MPRELRTWKVTNTTIKQRKLDEEGKDTRTLVERVGHGVQFKTEEGKRLHILQVNGTEFVHAIDGGLINLARGGFIKIEEVDDIGAELAKQTFVTPLAKPAPKKASRVTASLMGEAPKASKGGIESEDAVNPDGDPNFIAKAKHAGKTQSTGAAGYNVTAKPRSGNRRKAQDGVSGSQS